VLHCNTSSVLLQVLRNTKQHTRAGKLPIETTRHASAATWNLLAAKRLQGDTKQVTPAQCLPVTALHLAARATVVHFNLSSPLTLDAPHATCQDKQL
jgi:hypothetical protein